LGEMEVREASLKKSEYLCRIGDKVYSMYWIAVHHFFVQFRKGLDCAVYVVVTHALCSV
jgi:hypothetical protein